MDELGAVERLVRQARKERPPAGDVTGVVLGRLRTKRPASLLPLSMMAVAASLAAFVVLTLAIQTWSAGADPEAALYTVVEVPQP
jgi:hypothetical protein